MAREAAQAKAGCSQNACGVEDVLQLLRILYIIGGDSASNARTLQEGTNRCHGDETWTAQIILICLNVLTHHQSVSLRLCADVDELQFNASPEEFTSKKITTKILQQIEVRHSFVFYLLDAA